MPTPTPATCMLGIQGVNVRVELTGLNGADACAAVIYWVHLQGLQPIAWDGRTLDGQDAIGRAYHHESCSDSLFQAGLIYEVVDSGQGFYGTQLCQFLVGRYGSSGGLVSDPLGIMRAQPVRS